MTEKNPQEKVKHNYHALTQQEQLTFLTYIKTSILVVQEIGQYVSDLTTTTGQLQFKQARIQKIMTNLGKLREFKNNLKRMSTFEKDKHVNLDIDMLLLFITLIDDECILFVKIFINQFNQNISQGKEADYQSVQTFNLIEMKKCNILANIERFNRTFPVEI